MVTQDEDYSQLTLRDLWERLGMSPTEFAGLANISTPTLYKALHKQPIARRGLLSLCAVLGITESQYRSLKAE